MSFRILFYYILYSFITKKKVRHIIMNVGTEILIGLRAPSLCNESLRKLFLYRVRGSQKIPDYLATFMPRLRASEDTMVWLEFGVGYCSSIGLFIVHPLHTQANFKK